jgi:hypothetical protein
MKIERTNTLATVLTRVASSAYLMTFIAMAIMSITFAFFGCSVTFPSDTFQCGQNDVCPPGLQCRIKDRMCVSADRLHALEIGEQSSTGDQVNSGTNTDGRNSAVAEVIQGGAGGSRATSSSLISSALGKGGKTGAERARGGAGGAAGRAGSAGAKARAGFDCGDDTCTDRTTGLEWLHCSVGQAGANCSGDVTSMTWQSAVDACDQLTLAGHDDWRLPDVHELVSIVDYTKANPSIYPDFPSTPAAGFWSSTTTIANNTKAWGVGFMSGYVASDNKTVDVSIIPIIGSVVSRKFATRCVRAGTLKTGGFRNGLVDGKDLVVYDDANLLMWQGCSAGQSGITCSGNAETYTWQDAQSYCNKLNYGGARSGWRLPEIKELLSIVNYENDAVAIDSTVFPNIADSPTYWTATPIVGLENSAWFVSFGDGSTAFPPINDFVPPNTLSADVGTAYNVRCVKNTR